MAEIVTLKPATDAAERATRLQRQAADPAVNAWVNASAGSGKTTVLRDRVLRLLLAGARPTAVLCSLHPRRRGGDGESHRHPTPRMGDHRSRGTRQGSRAPDRRAAA